MTDDAEADVLPSLGEKVGTALRCGGWTFAFGAENFGGDGGGMREVGAEDLIFGVAGTLAAGLGDTVTLGTGGEGRVEGAFDLDN